MTTEPYVGEQGRSAAFLVYVLYLLSIPSAAVFALIGVVVAYAAAGGASGASAAHLRDQIRMWWIAFWWTVTLIALAIPAAILVIVLIGIPILWLLGAIAVVVMLWFTVKSVFGLVALLNGRGP